MRKHRKNCIGVCLDIPLKAFVRIFQERRGWGVPMVLGMYPPRLPIETIFYRYWLLLPITLVSLHVSCSFVEWRLWCSVRGYIPGPGGTQLELDAAVGYAAMSGIGRD